MRRLSNSRNMSRCWDDENTVAFCCAAPMLRLCCGGAVACARSVLCPLLCMSCACIVSVRCLYCARAVHSTVHSHSTAATQAQAHLSHSTGTAATHSSDMGTGTALSHTVTHIRSQLQSQHTASTAHSTSQPNAPNGYSTPTATAEHNHSTTGSAARQEVRECNLGRFRKIIKIAVKTGASHSTTPPPSNRELFYLMIRLFGWIRSSLRKRLPIASYTGGPNLSEKGMDLLLKMLCYDPEQRITATEALKHEWFQESPKPQATSMMPTFPSLNKEKRFVSASN